MSTSTKTQAVERVWTSSLCEHGRIDLSANDGLLSAAFDSLDAAREGLVIMNRDFRVVRANRAVIELFEYVGDDLVGRAATSLISPRNNLTLRQLQRVLERERRWAGACWMLTKSGKNLLCSTSLHFEVISGVPGIIMSIAHGGATASAKEHINFLLHHDPRSGLPNREGAVCALREMVKRGVSDLVVLVVGVSNMSSICDSFGWRIAEHVNETIARRILSTIEDEDILATKIGDGRFCLITQSNSKDAIQVLGRRIAMSIYNAIEIQGREVFPVPVIGYAQHPAHGEDEDLLIENASIAMSLAVKGLVGLVNEFTPNSRALICQQVNIEHVVRKAVKTRNFRFMAQPQIDMKAMVVTGAEILIRPGENAAGCLPSDIIQTAEATGMIHEIGRQALFAGMEFSRDFGSDRMIVSVNASSIQFTEQTIVGDVKETLIVTGADARKIGIEITESVLFNEQVPVGQQIEALKGLGCQIIIDDFGTGCANFAYLKRYASLIDKIKIDRMFIMDCLENRESAVISRSIINLACDLGLEVIAEGVETEDVALWLQKNGCTIGQGFLYSKALPTNEFWRACHAITNSKTA